MHPSHTGFVQGFLAFSIRSMYTRGAAPAIGLGTARLVQQPFGGAAPQVQVNSWPLRMRIVRPHVLQSSAS